MKITNIASVVIVVASLAIRPTLAQVYGQGVGMTDSCGAFVAELKKHGPGDSLVNPDGTRNATMSYLYMTWVAGYLTAENIHRTQEKQIKVDRDGLAGWLKNYCEKNPAHTIQQATYVMAQELKQ